MSGVMVGTRLDHLLELERAVRVQIELERRAGTTATRREVSETSPALPRQGSSPASPAVTDSVVVPVRAVRVDVIRDWAATHGYTLTDRGRIPHVVLEEFAAAHR